MKVKKIISLLLLIAIYGLIYQTEMRIKSTLDSFSYNLNNHLRWDEFDLRETASLVVIKTVSNQNNHIK